MAAPRDADGAAAALGRALSATLRRAGGVAVIDANDLTSEVCVISDGFSIPTLRGPPSPTTRWASPTRQTPVRALRRWPRPPGARAGGRAARAMPRGRRPAERPSRPGESGPRSTLVGNLRDNAAAPSGGGGARCRPHGDGQGQRLRARCAQLATRAALAGGATWLGVSSMPRPSGYLASRSIAGPTLDRFYPRRDGEAGAHDLDMPCSTSNRHVARHAAARPARRPAPVKLDTGMSRLGAPASDIRPLRRALGTPGRRGGRGRLHPLRRRGR